MKKLIKSEYAKHHSFKNFISGQPEAIQYQKGRAIRVLESFRDEKLRINHEVTKNKNFSEIIADVLRDLKENSEDALFQITQFIAEEMNTYSDDELVRFLYHRYRYDVYPQKYKIDNYPPYLQIEPSSLCNYKCVFCYQTDKSFFKKSTPEMGQMSLELYQQIVDEVEGKVEFLSLASRGEPLMAKNIEEMLKYSVGKFLNLKINTNASLLNEKKIHALLSGGVKTVVFSADAAEEPLYSQLRVNGSLERVLKNVDHFQEIRSKHYSELKILTRVSGVKVNDSQDIADMQKQWGNLVDQIAFVDYNPWENIYESKPNGQEKPCSDLFRRMFIWQDGKTNPCDSDYKSMLTVGKFPEMRISELWTNADYELLRSGHRKGNRQLVEPCKRCAVV